MDHYKLILPEHLNHHGYLFGGNMLKWIDEFAYITANHEFPGNNFLTVALDNVTFRKSVSMGQIVRFQVERSRLGTTSVQYRVQAFGTRHQAHPDEVIFETHITFVAVDEAGQKKPIIKT
jgi:acyl-CoA hydrolase